jgi:hypothetical protein
MNSPLLKNTWLMLIFCMTASACITSCQSYRTRRVVFKNHPIALYVVNKVVDEENLEYSVKFRNIGREILSFDYTLADEDRVPHVDSAGPNSGLVENLYPGAEVEVANPMNTMTVWATLGTVTYGKKTKEELAGIYKLDQSQPVGIVAPATGAETTLIPLPQPAAAPTGL